MSANAELDRVLAAQEARLGSLSVRSAGLTAAIALSGSVLAAQVQANVRVSAWLVTALILAALIGVVVLLGADLRSGRSADKLVEWSMTHPGQFETLLVTSKAIACAGNEPRLRRLERVFYWQALMVGLSIIIAMLDTRVDWL